MKQRRESEYEICEQTTAPAEHVDQVVLPDAPPTLTADEALALLNLCILSEENYDDTSENAVAKLASLCRRLLGKE